MAVAERITPLEFDFLWELLGGGELPYPIARKSHGETVEERAVLRQRTREKLVERGILDAWGRPQPRIVDLFQVLSHSDRSLDTVYLTDPGAEPVAAVAASYGGHGVLATQTGGGLRLRAIPPDGLASAISGLLPHVKRGTEKSVTLPLDELMIGPGVDFRRPGLRPDSPSSRSRASGANGVVARDESWAEEQRKTLARLQVQPRIRGGQIGANARDRATGSRTRASVLSWFDTDTGRYFTQALRGRDGRDWITIAPADIPSLRHRLGEMLANAAAKSAL